MLMRDEFKRVKFFSIFLRGFMMRYNYEKNYEKYEEKLKNLNMKKLKY
jgi:hypothetical protein